MAALRVLACLVLIAGVSSSETTDCSYVSLLKHLKLTPENDVLAITRPVRNWTTPTSVQMDVLLYGILHVDEKSQTVTSHIWIQMTWSNEFIRWNSSEFCGIETLSVPRSRVWIPDISIQEDASDTGSTSASTLATLFPTGFVLASARQRLVSTCHLNLALFPFDTQKCNFTFGSMSNADSNIKLGTLMNDSALFKVSREIMVTRGEWELTNMEVLSYSTYVSSSLQSRLVYRVTLDRKPMLYVINFIVPLFYLLILDLASFFINEARGEKLSFKVTVLLSISVLLLILQDMLPSTEDTLPMIAVYCVAIFALVGISVLEAMLVSFLFDLDYYCGVMSQRSACASADIQLKVHKDTESAADEDEGPVKPEKNYLPLVDINSRDLLKLILEEVKDARQEAERAAREEKAKLGRYRRVAEIIDSVFFALYVITVVTFLACMYSYWIHGFAMR